MTGVNEYKDYLYERMVAHLQDYQGVPYPLPDFDSPLGQGHTFFCAAIVDAEKNRKIEELEGRVRELETIVQGSRGRAIGQLTTLGNLGGEGAAEVEEGMEDAEFEVEEGYEEMVAEEYRAGLAFKTLPVGGSKDRA